MSSQTNVYHANKNYLTPSHASSINPYRTLIAGALSVVQILALGSFLLFNPLYSYAAGRWHYLSPGIAYQDIASKLLSPWTHIYAFQIDLDKNKLALVNAKNLGLKNASVDQFAEHSKALLSINGGFFDHEFNPLGLRISNNKQKNPLKQISWWGIFYLKNNKAYISSLKHFTLDNDIDFAIQSGPRLLVKGKIPSLKPGDADRSALGITKEGKIIILVSTNAAISTNKLAHLLKAPPLSCIDAINLDGGSSSQLYAHIGSFLLNVHGFSNVSDAIIVKKGKVYKS